MSLFSENKSDHSVRTWHMCTYLRSVVQPGPWVSMYYITDESPPVNHLDETLAVFW